MRQSYSYVARSWRHPPLRALAGREARLADVVSYIKAHLGDPNLGAGRLQSAFCISRSSLYRMFSRSGGVAHFIRKQRLAVAGRRLRGDADLGITQLLYELGFSSERQFQRAFLAEFGVTPSQWRERCKTARISQE